MEAAALRCGDRQINYRQSIAGVRKRRSPRLRAVVSPTALI
jgi:hypothetical protein